MEASFALWVLAGPRTSKGVTMAPFMITESLLISRPLPVNNIISPPLREAVQGDSRVGFLVFQVSEGRDKESKVRRGQASGWVGFDGSLVKPGGGLRMHT